MPAYESRLAGAQSWVDPASLPQYGDASQISGNAPDFVKQLSSNTLGSYGVGDPDCFAHAAGRAIKITSVDIHKVGDKWEACTVSDVTVNKNMLNGAGLMHGGCLCYLIDNCASLPLVALGLMKNVNGVGVSQAMNTVFHAPAPLGARLRIESTSVTLGGRIMTSRCEVSDWHSGGLGGSFNLKKWRLSSHESFNSGSSRRGASTRGESAPPGLESVPTSNGNRIHGEDAIVKQPSNGPHVRSPKQIEEGSNDPEVIDVKMPEPTPTRPVLPMPVPIQMPVPDPALYSAVSASTPLRTPATEVRRFSFPKPLSPVVEMDAAQMLVTNGTAARVKAGPKAASKRESALNKIEDLDQTEPLQVVKSTVDVNVALGVIESGLKSFMEDIPYLMKGLDEVARIHPVVTVAVLAFKAVYTMEMTRRENDRRIKTLYVEMKDMIAVLVQLRDVKDPKEIGPDGQPIDSRLQGISQQTAADIKDCANTCDTYAKKRLVVKVLKSPVWESKLVGFIAVFTKRRGQFEEALAIHTARAVDLVQSTVFIMKTKLDSVDEKLALFNQMFQKLVPPDEVKIAERIKGKGDIKTIQKNDALLRDLNDFENSLDARPTERASKRSVFSSKDLRDELQEDFDLAIVKNLETFEGKFVLYQKQLKEELSKFIRDENDRLLVAVREGPHDRIKNESLREIWKEMNWRRNVKAKLFVLTLRDHFRDELYDVKTPLEGAPDQEDDERGTNDWTFEYLGLNWLQAIMEAFDEDGSGYVTVAEINRFTEALPVDLDWSLQHWIAYWAVGWEISAVYYAKAIHEILSAMFDMRPKLLPRNRYWADYHLDRVWPYIAELILDLRKREVPDLEHKFRPFMLKEEERIRGNLRDIRYDIDALDTVPVVAGPGRTETHVLPLVYLLLKRELQIFRMATRIQLHRDEIWDCADSHFWIQRSIEFRVDDLRNRYNKQQLNVDEQFRTVSCGMLNLVHDDSVIWLLSGLQASPFSELDESYSWYSSALEDEPEPVHDTVPNEDDGTNADAEKVSVASSSMYDYGAVPSDKVLQKLKRHLNYPLEENATFDLASYSEPEYAKTDLDMAATDPLQSLLGQWTGYSYTESEFPWTIMWQLDIHASPPEEPKEPSVIQNEGDAPLPYDANDQHDAANVVEESADADAQITPALPTGDGDNHVLASENIQDHVEAEAEEGVIRFNFSMSYPNTTAQDDHWSGHLDENGSLVGYTGWQWRPAEYSHDQQFILRRLPAEIMALRPSPAEFVDNKYRSLWQFAINATICQVRKKWWSWSFFKERRNNRQRYLLLNIANWTYGRRPEGEEFAEFMRMRKGILAQDGPLIRSMRDHLSNTLPCHFSVKCDACDQNVGGQRIMCLDCRPPGTRIRQTVNFCDLSVCGERTIRYSVLDRDFQHPPTHDLVKVRTVLLFKDMPALDRKAKKALESVQTVVDGEVVRDRSAFNGDNLLDASQGVALVEGAEHEDVSETIPVDGAAVNSIAVNGTTVVGTGADIDDNVVANGAAAHSSINGNVSSTQEEIVSPSSPQPPPDGALACALNGGPRGPHCYTCQKTVSQPCWYCIGCYDDVFLCDECEASHAFPCRSCGKPYIQPFLDFFYGERPEDSFLCNVCMYKNMNEPNDNWSHGDRCHIFTHPLVRCKERIEDPVEAASPTTDERLASLEARVGGIDTKLDRLQEQIEMMFTRMEQKLLGSLSAVARSEIPQDKKRS
ncbi:hypothetical protein EUX98_g4473 [Antrodiella citrinella]|uniref:EF-hand domain-containing protein n=1 Tax=Antrodiella citrinella TaxID=2447956 RepID=A0A4S4MU05_9APHY|nr:hypothetical protein EUX98_g4473 [Antrodiella citrinella]